MKDEQAPGDRDFDSSCELAHARRIGEAAAARGFDWDDPVGPLAKIGEEFEELMTVYTHESTNTERLCEEMGDLLFAAVNASRHLGVDPATALRKSVEKFTRRLDTVRRMAHQRGASLEALSTDELAELWEQAKG